MILKLTNQELNINQFSEENILSLFNSIIGTEAPVTGISDSNIYDTMESGFSIPLETSFRIQSNEVIFDNINTKPLINYQNVPNLPHQRKNPLMIATNLSPIFFNLSFPKE